MENIVFYSDGLLKNHISFYLMMSRFVESSGGRLTFFLDDYFESHLGSLISNKELSIIKKVRLLNRYDLVILESYQSMWVQLLINILIYKKQFLVIHNVNAWLNAPVKKSFKNFLKYIGRRFILWRSNGIIVVDDNLKEYINEENLYKKPIFCIPFSDYTVQSVTKEEHIKTEHIHFVVPGIVDHKRRDYQIVCETFEEVFKKGLPAKLVILGFLDQRDSKNSIILDLKDRYPDKVVVYFSFIDNVKFNEILSQADYFIGNLQIEFESSYTFETYSVSKASGITFLALEYCKKTFVPTSFKHYMVKGADSIFIDYSDANDLLALIINEMELDSHGISSRLKSQIKRILSQNVQKEMKSLNSFLLDN